MKLNKTAIYDSHVNLGATIEDFHGWLMPIKYKGLTYEHNYVRDKSGLFDVSHMGTIFVQGKDSIEYLNKIFTGDISKLKDKSVLYGFFLNEKAGIIDDLLIYRVNSDYFICVVNASNKEKDLVWMKKNLLGDVEVRDNSSEIAILALQGPKAQEILQKLTDFDLSKISFFKFEEEIDILGYPTMISRTGYTGEDGFELYIPKEVSREIFDKILEKGGENVEPAGLACRDTLRFEANLPLYGNELNEERNPIECGLGFFVDKNKEFIGSDIISNIRKEAKFKKTVGLELIDRGIARTGYKVYSENGTLIGEITTGYKSPTLNKVIAVCLINRDYASLNTIVYIEIRNKKIKAKVVSKKFLEKKNKKED